MIFENEYLQIIINAVTYLTATFILLFIGKFTYQLFHKKINVNKELVEKDNFAFSLSYVGYNTGLILAIGAALIGPSMGLINDLISIGIYGVFAILLLNISTILNDLFVLRKFNVRKEVIGDQNAGAGVVEAASSIASGLIILGAVSGEATGFIAGIESALIFWALGQVALILTSKVYDYITPYSIHKEIEKDNVAAGIGFAGAMIAIANIIRFAISDDFLSWTETFSVVSFNIAIGFLFLPIARIFADKILLPGRKLTDEIVGQGNKFNNGAALIEAFAYIGGSFLITWCI
jgi:uncharacterized membrane protein YjfL (UPF0719 family)